MSALLEWLVPALILSVLALIALPRVAAAHPRLGFVVAAAGIVAWLVPWPWLGVSFEVARVPATVIEPIARLELFEGSADTGAAIQAAWLVVALGIVLGPGLGGLARDHAQFRASIRRLRAASYVDESLRRRLPAALRGLPVEIRRMPGTRTALASGVLAPTIWIGDEFANEAEARLALVHECEHVRGLDPLAILCIHTLGRVLWWNPIVATLAHQAQLMLETACDHRSMRHVGRQTYLHSLAALVLNAESGSHSRLLAAVRSGHFDVERLALLRRDTHLQRRDLGVLAALAIAALGSAGFAVHEPPRPGFSRVAVPDTAAGRTLATLLEAHTSGDSALLGSYLGAYTPQEIAWPLTDFGDRIELVSVLTSGPRRIEYVLIDRRDGSRRRGLLELVDRGDSSIAAIERDAGSGQTVQ